MSLELFEKTVQRATGRVVDEIRRTPLTELRKQAEQKKGKPIRFVTFFPWIGRGNIMRDRLVSGRQADEEADGAIRDLEH